ncbi:DUF58 domain-containing protein [Cupriavidus pauculus]|uniref:DUF58 domain-containing protein n=1 Tax=Cupriavidus pauculus TaxID=82633 RepID=UPI0012484A04|nr:DUF58 domain-containing protein [Cupriavidus pauculus]KAB0596838.1 DUF58 domain-containing protein [Cupriavidus pauculus]UAL01826.1 DUF58 domain-containing protein [Cupriavidus pauculus]
MRNATPIPGSRGAPSALTPRPRRPRRPVNGVVTLDRRHLYILPTRGGLGFFVLLLAMLTTSLNYNISLGFALTFLLAGIGMACMWMAYRNLLDLELSAGAVSSTFAGNPATFALRATNRDDGARIGVEARTASTAPHEPASLTLDSQGAGDLTIHLPAPRRGRLALPRVTISSRFPFGLFHVWSYADFPLATLVYPSPEANAPPLPVAPHADEGDQGTDSAASDDGVDQLRRYRPGDPLHRIAWKHSARTGRWLSRTGHSQRQPECWIDWNALPLSMETEARLSRLCAWVLAAGDTMDVGLRLPGVEVAPARGAAHRRACLEALAVWPERRAP